MAERILHPIPPTWNRESEILILGSFPSVKSREMAYFYGHPQNRFWKVMSVLFEEEIPETAEGRRAFLLRRHIAAWDVIASCEISGSADSSIRDAEVNNLLPILEGAPIRQIYTNGKTADRLYQRYELPLTGRPAVCLPSTSPANAAWRLDRLLEAWAVIRSD
ncbi:MAG: DNA-deoxyinosine glycosylase [Oscillospiraceae bacterium]|nr:DNA-deoxyinosine glycosylase [Oscillospiraceae bacterium]